MHMALNMSTLPFSLSLYYIVLLTNNTFFKLVPISYVLFSGPTVDMINDFWKMIYQENTEKLIMLTNLTEENKVKRIDKT